MEQDFTLIEGFEAFINAVIHMFGEVLPLIVLPGVVIAAVVLDLNARRAEKPQATKPKAPVVEPSEEPTSAVHVSDFLPAGARLDVFDPQQIDRTDGGFEIIFVSQDTNGRAMVCTRRYDKNGLLRWSADDVMSDYVSGGPATAMQAARDAQTYLRMRSHTR